MEERDRHADEARCRQAEELRDAYESGAIARFAREVTVWQERYPHLFTAEVRGLHDALVEGSAEAFEPLYPLPPLTEEDLQALRALCAAAPPGPWAWTETAINDWYRQRYGKRSRNQFVFLLQGLHSYGLDPYVHQVMQLPWTSVKGTSIVKAAPPNRADRAILAWSRTAIPALLNKIEDLERQVHASRASQTNEANPLSGGESDVTTGR